ncbi:hypothetical protein FDO65_08750 [Nakamurella flava]|uniref:Exo-alpha-sialidase n=1 Tax=Nakamurella flava TaxID=2576308 RepID=A0A4U6QM15_9ACTN|nr:hypothetical protein [Nakamurella flava]TKV61630.1 hypothetical protein FDO65_08750 [Nakamurella flava]
MTLLERLADILRHETATVVVEPPGTGTGFWAGGPSAVRHDGIFHLAYRLRRPVDAGRGYANVVATSTDGVHFETACTVPVGDFDSASLERPALVRRPDGGWRLYVSCSTLGSKHWWVEALDTAADGSVADLATGTRTVVLPGDEATAWKDVVVQAPTTDDGPWRMWACRHPLDGGDDAADRMQTWYFTSPDGLRWDSHGAALVPTADSWDARGTRVTSVLPVDDGWLALYDGRASAAENWYERTGLALGSDPGSFRPVAGPLQRDGRTLRYVCVVPAGDHWRIYFEADRPDGSNVLLTTVLPLG